MKDEQKQALIQDLGAETIVDTLIPYLTSMRTARIEEVLRSRLQGVQLAIEAPADINNALATVRTCEAFGVSTVHLICLQGDTKYARSITKGAIYWVNVLFYENFSSFLERMMQEQIQLMGATIHATHTLSEVPVEKPLCILIGNEQRGLSPEACQACALQYTIPMFGMTESFNLSVSAGISLYDITQRKRAQLQTAGDLMPQARMKLKAEYYLNSIEPRLALALLRQKNNG